MYWNLLHCLFSDLRVTIRGRSGSIVCHICCIVFLYAAVVCAFVTSGIYNSVVSCSSKATAAREGHRRCCRRCHLGAWGVLAWSLSRVAVNWLGNTVDLEPDYLTRLAIDSLGASVINVKVKRFSSSDFVVWWFWLRLIWKSSRNALWTDCEAKYSQVWYTKQFLFNIVTILWVYTYCNI